MLLARARAVGFGVVAAVAALSLCACGSSQTRSAGSSSSAVTSSAAPGRAAQGLERALTRSARPRPVAVTCRLESPSERGRSPFGATGPSVYSCSLRASGGSVAYDVQMLRNGCFVAERRQPGKAIYGCGAVAPARP